MNTKRMKDYGGGIAIYLLFPLVMWLLILAFCCCNGGPQPPEPPIPPEPPLYDWKVCIDSGKLRNTYCPPDRIEIRKYPEGEEPTECCDFHKEPEPEIPQLAERFRVPVIKARFGFPIYASAFFAKDLAINFAEFSREDAKAFVYKLARENLSNNARMFFALAYPTVCHYPHPKKADGKYDLNTINPVWFAQLRETIRWCVDCKLMVRLVVFDEHSYNRRWNWIWCNPDLNDGFRCADGQVRPLYTDKYLHTKWSNYCVRDDEICQGDCKERYCTSMEYLFFLYDEVIGKLNDEFGDYIAFESNEINAADFWHHDIGIRLRDRYGIPKWRMITSPKGGVEWINTKANIRNRWIPEVHGVKDLETYNEVQAAIIVPWIWSWDGYGGRAFVDRWDELRIIARKSLADGWTWMQENEGFRSGGFGIGGNNWLTNDDLDFANIDYKSGEVIMDELDKFLSTH